MLFLEKSMGATLLWDPFLHSLDQGVVLCTRRVCTLGFWAPKPWNMALNEGIWDPKPRVTNIKGTNLKSLSRRDKKPFETGFHCMVHLIVHTNDSRHVF